MSRQLVPFDPQRELQRVRKRNLWIWRGNAVFDIIGGICLMMTGHAAVGMILWFAALPALWTVGLLKKDLKR